jgi:glycine/D-amino acid oxidase-like deaminating enzyme
VARDRHEGAGVALGPVTGRLIAQAYCGEPSPIDLDPFDPDRFDPDRFDPDRFRG